MKSQSKQSKLDTLTRLSIRHAEISAELKTNKDQMAKELSYCNGGEFVKPESESCVDFSFLETSKNLGKIPWGATCMNYAYEAFGEFNKDGDNSYDEILSNYGCRHCNSVRSLKKHIGKLNSERGRIHSALTIIGKSLMHLKQGGNRG